MGPTVLFDKSFIEMLNVDEAVIFDCLYMSVIAPVYYTEVLADLSLGDTETGGRAQSKVVADLAVKTPVIRAYPSPVHTEICLNELLGMQVEMRGRPMLPGGRPVRHRLGGVGMVYDQNPVMDAFSRWQRKAFWDLEHRYAAVWRAQLKTVNLRELSKLAKDALSPGANPRNLGDVYTLARQVLNEQGNFTVLKAAYTLLGLPRNLWETARRRWRSAGYPALSTYAPYTAHCLLADVFFYLAADKRLVSPDRPSNKIDFAYLYYLPFVKVFVSNDKLHRRVAGPFLRDDQTFISGDELKVDLQMLVRHYSALPQEQLERGVFKVAGRPPDDDSCLTTRLWKKYYGELPAEEAEPDNQDPRAKELVADLLALSKDRSVGPFTKEELGDPQYLSIERKIPVRRGRWRVLPPEIEKSQRS